MAGNKPVVLFFLLLAFLFILTASLVLVFKERGLAFAATAGLFIMPVLFVYFAAVIVAVRKRRLHGFPSAAVSKPAAKKEPVRYPWEGMFGIEEKEYVERRKPVLKPSAAGSKPGVAVIIVIAAVALILLVALQQKAADVPGSNKTIEAKQDAGEKPAGEVKLQLNFTSVRLSAAAKKVADSARGFGGKIKSKLTGAASSLKSRIQKVPSAAWEGVAVAAVAFLLVYTVFYSHGTGQLGGIQKWFRGWLGWLLGIFSYAGKNKLKVLLWLVLVAVVCAAIAAVVFRKWLIAKFPSVSASGLIGMAVNALIAVRDFVLVYRIYIIIGIFVMLAVIGILVAFEKKSKGKD